MTRPVLAEDVEVQEVDWLWEERIPRKMLSFIAGKRDMGKGLVSVHIGAALTRQGLNVLHSAAEDDPGLMTKPRYMAAGAALKHLHLWRFRLPENQDELMAYVIEHSIDLIVIDPVASHLSHGINRFSDNIRVVTGGLQKIAETTGCAVLFIEHALKKATGNDPLDCIGGGASGLVAATRMGFIYGKDPADPDRSVLCNEKHNICQKRPALAFETDVHEVDVRIRNKAGVLEDKTLYMPMLLVEGETEFDAMQLLKKPKDDEVVTGRPASKREAAMEWLTNYLFQAGQPVLARVIVEDAKQMGMSRKTLYRAATDMHVVKDPVGGGKNCKWTLSDEAWKLMTGDGVTPDTLPDDAEFPDADGPVFRPDLGSMDMDEELRQLIQEETGEGGDDE